MPKASAPPTRRGNAALDARPRILALHRDFRHVIRAKDVIEDLKSGLLRTRSRSRAHLLETFVTARQNALSTNFAMTTSLKWL